MVTKIYDYFIKLSATFFFLGYSPIAPGTVGTIGAVFLFLLVMFVPQIYYLIFVSIFTAFSIFVSNKCLTFYDNKDPGEVVIDEVCGFLFTMIFIPFSWINIIMGFILFRIFDIIKPYPIKKIENLKGGYGIVLDDVLAGLYANIIMQIFININ